MHSRQILSIAVLLPVLVSSYKLVPYSDSSCTKQIKVLANRFSSDSPEDREEFEALDADNGISNTMRAGARWYYNLDFPDAQPLADNGNKGVWWKIDQPGNGCGVALLKEFMNDMNWQTVPDVNLPGDIIINARKNGCYFSSMPVSANIGTTFCCGRSDCDILDLGTDALNIKRNIIPLERAPTSPAARASALVREKSEAVVVNSEPKPRIVKRNRPEIRLSRAIGSSIRPRDGVPDFDWTKCNKDGWGPDDYKVAPGRQIAVTKIQPCDSTMACDFTISQTSQSSTTISSSRTQTITNSVGTSITVEAGSELLGGKVANTISVDLAVALADETGHSFTNATSSTVQQSIKQQIGTRAFLSFTPLYRCWTPRFNCNGPVDWTLATSEFTYCVPQVVSDGSADGYYTVVIV